MEDSKQKTAVEEQPLSQESSHPTRREKQAYYVPTELRTWFLVLVCLITLAIFVLLQLAAASTDLRSLGSHLSKRQDACAPGATCAPAPSSFTDMNPSDSSSIPMQSPTPNPDSYTDFNSDGGSTAPPPGHFTGFALWGPGYYFLGAYLSTIVAVLYGLLWKCIFFRMKEMEPMFQLAGLRGQYGQWSLYLKYSDSNFLKTILMSIGNAQWLVLIGAVNLVLVTVVTALAPEVLYIRTTGDCGPTGNGQDCTPRLAIRAPLAWALGAIIFIVFMIAVALTFRLRQRKSGIFTEATSIAGVATLIHNPSLPYYFAQSHDNPSPFERFGLGQQNDPDGTRSYGLISEIPPGSAAAYAHQQPAPMNTKIPFLVTLPAIIVLWIVAIGVLLMVALYRYVSKIEPGNGFETFMDSESFGVRFLFACIGLGIRTWWGKLDDWNRKIAPFRALAQDGGATAESSVLLSSDAHALAALISINTLRRPFDGLVSCIAVLGEVLIVTLAGVPFSTAESYQAFNVSVLLSVAILGSMALVLPVLAIRFHHHRNSIPRPPECLAHMIRLFTDTETLSLFHGLSELERKKRDKVIRAKGLRWHLDRGEYGNWILKASTLG